MKKILIISYNFAPRHTVGAIRPTKLAQYLAEMGDQVDVVTVKPYGKLDHSMDAALALIHHVYEIDSVIVDQKTTSSAGPAKAQTASAPKPKQNKKSLLGRLKLEAYDLKKIRNSYKFAAAFGRLIKSNIEQFRSYDAVFSTYGPAASHLCGLKMKELCPGVLWIADFRDPMVIKWNMRSTLLQRRRIQKKVCRKADRLVAVSQGYFDRIFDGEARKKASVIYNGFDRRDVDIPAVVPDGEFSFTYVGTIWDDDNRDVSPLFRALEKLIEEGRIDAQDVCVNYAGGTFAAIKKQADSCGYTGRLADKGMLARDDCLRLQASSRHLLLATWNINDEYGVFPGKFLEYIMIGRPIISLVSGDRPDCEVTEVMKRGRLGPTYEALTREHDFPLLCEYLENDYRRFKDGLAPDYSPDAAVVESFDFANTAKQIRDLI